MLIVVIWKTFQMLSCRNERFIRHIKRILHFRVKAGSISETTEFVKCSRAAMSKGCRALQMALTKNKRLGNCGGLWPKDER